MPTHAERRIFGQHLRELLDRGSAVRAARKVKRLLQLRPDLLPSAPDLNPSSADVNRSRLELFPSGPDAVPSLADMLVSLPAWAVPGQRRGNRVPTGGRGVVVWTARPVASRNEAATGRGPECSYHRSVSTFRCRPFLCPWRSLVARRSGSCLRGSRRLRGRRRSCRS